MLLRCITVPVFAVTSSAKLLHRHRRESAACRGGSDESWRCFLPHQTNVLRRCQRECCGSLLLASDSLAMLRPDRGTELQ